MKEGKETIYIDPLCDFGCKKLFGHGSGEPSLIDFLNSVLKLDKPIVKITFIANEYVGELKEDRSSVFDVHAIDLDGNYLIVEVQRGRQDYFKHRSVFYSMFPIREQSEKGEWNYN